jgi:hypothetical protein
MTKTEKVQSDINSVNKHLLSDPKANRDGTANATDLGFSLQRYSWLIVIIPKLAKQPAVTDLVNVDASFMATRLAAATLTETRLWSFCLQAEP